MFAFVMGSLAAVGVFYFIGLTVQLIRIEKAISDIATIAEAKVARMYNEG